MSHRSRIRIGDVFTVPLDRETIGFGQVVAKYGKDAYFFALFERTSSCEAEADLNDVVQSPVVFLALVAGGATRISLLSGPPLGPPGTSYRSGSKRPNGGGRCPQGATAWSRRQSIP